MKYLIEILVVYKEGLLDPEANTIEKAIRENLGFDIEQLKTGKYFSYISKKHTRDEAKKEAEDLTNKVLTNPLIEDYRILAIKKQ